MTEKKYYRQLKFIICCAQSLKTSKSYFGLPYMSKKSYMLQNRVVRFGQTKKPNPNVCFVKRNKDPWTKESAYTYRITKIIVTRKKPKINDFVRTSAFSTQNLKRRGVIIGHWPLRFRFDSFSLPNDLLALLLHVSDYYFPTHLQLNASRLRFTDDV